MSGTRDVGAPGRVGLGLEEDPPGVGEQPGRVDVTVHARLAWLKRVSVTEPHPADAIRREWRRSDPVPALEDARKTDRVRLIYETDGETATILTVYEPREVGG